jgi:hypothetical protein
MNSKLFFTMAAVALAIVAIGCNKSGKLGTTSHFTPPAGPMKLELKWPQGERIVQDLVLTQAMVITIPGRLEPIKQNVTIGEKYSLTVLNSNPDGSHELELQFLSLRVSLPSGRRQIHYDSEKDSASGSSNPVVKAFSQIVGAKIQYYLDASNNVERIEGVDDLLDRLSSGGTVPPTVKNIFNENSFKQLMSYARFIPPNPVQPGDTWPVQIQMVSDAVGTINQNFDFTFARWEQHGERNCARLEFSGTMQTDRNAPPSSNIPGATISLQDGSFVGVLWFDPEFGISIDSQVNEDMTLLITIPRRNPNAAAGSTQVITNQLTQVLNFKLDSLN